MAKLNPLRLVVRLTGVEVVCTLFKRATHGPYWVRFSVGKKQHRVPLKTADLATAREKARDEVEKAGRPVVESYTLAAAMGEFFAPGGHGAKVEKRTRNGYKTALNRLVKQIGGETDLASLDTDSACAIVREYLATLAKEGQSARSAINRLAGLAVFFAECMRSVDAAKKFRVRWEFNPADRKRNRVLKPPASAPVMLTDEETAILLTAGKEYSCWPSILLCRMEGFRPAEACDALFKHIDFDNGVVMAYSKKTKHPRKPPILPYTYKGKPLVCGPHDTAVNVKDELSELIAVEREQCKAVGLEYDAAWRIHSGQRRIIARSFQEFREAWGLGEHVTLQACRQTRSNELIRVLTGEDYFHWMGHDRGTAHQFYVDRDGGVGK